MLKLRWLKEQRGSMLLFIAVLVLPVMIVLGGLAMDMAYLGEVKNELQRSMDAAALAGAGNLGFNSSYFPAAIAAAQNYALLNPFRVGTVTLTPSLGNAEVPPSPGTGNIVLGIWNGAAFTASLDGTQVNAVKCQYATTIPTSFLRLAGVLNLSVSAMAIGWAPPPGTPPPTSCVFPIALSACFFGGATSLGCGATVTFISSSDSSAVGGNTAAWANLLPGATNVNAQTTREQVEAAVNGTCQGAQVNTGNQIPVSGGEFNVVMNYLMDQYPQIYSTSPILTVYTADGVTKAYEGQGWEVFAPVIDTGSGCPPSQIVGEKTIVGWTRFVITQVLNSNGRCAVANHWPGNPWDAHCFQDKNGTATDLPPGWSGQKGIFGYYNCQYMPSPPAPVAGPIAATATLKLAK